MRDRLRHILAMPPEPLEILAGAGATLWAVGWLLLTANPGPAYQDLAHLPASAQALILVVAIVGGTLQIATAWFNEARLRFVADVAMAVFFMVILVYVFIRTGLGPTSACYMILIGLDVLAAVMLRRSGYVRVG